MANEPRANRVLTMMSDSELRQLDDWMFEHRIRGRSEAIRRLIQLGMRHSPGAAPAPARKVAAPRKRPARLAMTQAELVIGDA